MPFPPFWLFVLVLGVLITTYLVAGIFGLIAVIGLWGLALV